MHPEWATYQVSPHARVRCVDCHVGEGVDALVDSKLNGARQMFLAMFNAYERPVPTPCASSAPPRRRARNATGRTNSTATGSRSGCITAWTAIRRRATRP